VAPKAKKFPAAKKAPVKVTLKAYSKTEKDAMVAEWLALLAADSHASLADFAVAKGVNYKTLYSWIPVDAPGKTETSVTAAGTNGTDDTLNIRLKTDRPAAARQPQLFPEEETPGAGQNGHHRFPASADSAKSESPSGHNGGLPIATLVKNTGQYMETDPRLIVVDEGFNERINFGDMEWLCDNICKVGVNRPLTVYKRDDKFVLIDGERRLRAVLMAIERGIEFKRVPVLIRSGKMLASRLKEEMVLSNDGKHLLPVEEGGAFLKFQTWNWTLKEIAARFNRSESHVQNCIMLAESCRAIVEILATGKISAKVALGVVNSRKSDEDKIKELQILIEEVDKTGVKQATPSTVQAISGEEKALAGKKIVNGFRWVQSVLEKDEKSFNPTKREVFLVIRDFMSGKKTDEEVMSYFSE
jgi:ParB-like chromosome segregation protein Spo0J